MHKLATLALLLALPVAAQELATTVKATEVVPGIYMLEGADGFSSNMGLLVGDEHVLLIDDGMAPITASLIATIAELAGRPLDFVVNTHAHGDHVGSNATLAENGAIVFAHDNLRQAILDSVDQAGGPAGLPVVTFSDEVTFHVNGHPAIVMHLAAAHTDGDAAVVFPSQNVIDAGDLFFNALFPFIDLDSGGSVAGYKAGQQRLLDLANDQTRIIPGHGPLASKADLQAALDMLIDAEARVQKLVAAGMSQEQVLEANPLADYHEKWNWGFITTERMTSMLYRSLTDGQ
ncbi:MAG: MBL fold metallo-hydrolase [Gammaproteobacteria bacterium]|nr:MBL fold metallo-hydrolase [Gammaproteobacteria bacterium]MDH5322288.1 MBL fold metallo-hydrolase [Gammaproteobacteria bacterium]